MSGIPALTGVIRMAEGYMTADTAQAPKDLIGFLDFYLAQKAPFQIPENGKEWIVTCSAS